MPGAFAMRLSLLFGLPLSVLLLRCQVQTVSGAPADVPDAAAPVDVADAAPPRSDECIAQDTKIQAALDLSRTSPNAVVAVKNVACGTSVYASGDPATATKDSVFRVGSITKTFVSAMILSLVDDGTVSLDDLLEKWIPAIPNTTGVTVRMLLNHTSGIFDFTQDIALAANRAKPTTPDAIIAAATAHAPYFAPGAGWQYSNTNYFILGRIAEKATGQPLGALLHARAIDRAALKSTFFDGSDTIGAPLARGFDGTNADATFADDPSFTWAAGAVVASGADLAEWIDALYAGNVLSAAGLKALVASPAATDQSGLSYGLGVMILSPAATGGEGQALGHNGRVDGFTSEALYFADRRTTVVTLCNQDTADENALLIQVTDALWNAP